MWLKIDSQLMRRCGFHCGETGCCVTAAILVEADRCQTLVAPDFKQLAANRQEYVEGTRVCFCSNQHKFGACRALFIAYLHKGV